MSGVFDEVDQSFVADVFTAAAVHRHHLISVHQTGVRRFAARTKLPQTMQTTFATTVSPPLGVDIA